LLPWSNFYTIDFGLAHVTIQFNLGQTIDNPFKQLSHAESNNCHNSIYSSQTIVKIAHAYIQNILADPFISIHQKLTVTKSLNHIANVNQEIRRKVVKPWQPRHLDEATLSRT